MSETAWFRGEGGGLHEFALPLSEVYAEQERKGWLTRADPPAPASAGAPEAGAVEPLGVDPSLGSLERPPRSDPKAEWLAYARQISNRDDLDELSKAELIKEFG